MTEDYELYCDRGKWFVREQLYPENRGFRLFPFGEKVGNRVVLNEEVLEALSKIKDAEGVLRRAIKDARSGALGKSVNRHDIDLACDALDNVIMTLHRGILNGGRHD
ncbi:MAG: hypothetical protein E6R04_06450 [Spirochaetes bacterium]|nr:MAG: hypothetical protein E6R04_06450 [Spirochaetota bacterium]